MNTTCDPQTLLEAVRHFSDLDVCNEYMVRIKWPNGVIVCPQCGSEKIGRIKSRRMFQCKAKECRKQFSAKVSTIFEDSPLGLDKWFVAVWCIANAENGISSHELGRALGVTQKTAWFMLHRIREAMRTGTFRKIIGVIETDETLVGGKKKFMHADKRAAKAKGTGAMGKVIVHGLLERGGEVRARVVKDQKRATLQGEVRRQVQEGATVYSDALLSYVGLNDQYVHEMIDHAVEYIRGRVHTNGLENFWSLLKRTIRGTYVAMSTDHLDRYLDEQAWRFNNRRVDDGGRFFETIKSVVGKRLTYAALTATEP
jgi:transposase-like protein